MLDGGEPNEPGQGGIGDSAALTALIDEWTTGNNAGLLLKNTGDAYVSGRYAAARFSTQEAAGSTPELVVNYTTVPEPATMAMLGLGGVMMLIRRRR